MWSRFWIGILFVQASLALVSYYYGGWEGALLVFSGLGYVVVSYEFAIVPFLLVPTTASIICFSLLLRTNRQKVKKASIITGVVPVIVFFTVAEGVTAASMKVALRDINEKTCLFGVRSFSAAAYEIFENSIIFWNPSHSHHAHVALSRQRVMIWSYQKMEFDLAKPELHPLRWVAEHCRPLFKEL